METKFREARERTGMKAVRVAELVGVARGTFSLWETGQKLPSYENLIKLADIYGCSIDYLLGRAHSLDQTPAGTEKINMDAINVYHNKPVWSMEHGWLLVDGIHGHLTAADGTTYQYADFTQLYSIPEGNFISPVPDSKPLTYDQVQKEKTVWVEPISTDRKLAEQLRGWYHLNGPAVQNEFNQRFYLDTYGKDWIAYV